MDRWLQSDALVPPAISLWDLGEYGVLWRAAFEALPLSSSSNGASLTSSVSAMGLTFTRASAATVQTAPSTVVTSGIGVDVPRIGNAGYGPGLCFEPGRTNSALFSSALATAPWGATAVTITANAATAPDGTTTADRVAETATTNVHVNQQTTVATSGTQKYAWSGWAKQGTQRYCVVRVGTTAGYEVTVDLQTRAATNLSGATAEVVGTAAGWIRAAAMFTPAAGTATVQFALSDTGGAYHSYAGNTANHLDGWGFQLEAGGYPTELIETAGATASRSGDRLRHTSPSSLFATGGRLRLDAKFVPKGSLSSTSVDYTDDITLWTQVPASVTAYANIDYTTRKLRVAVGGSVDSFALPLSWSRGDIVEMFVCSGDGKASAKYRVNGGPCHSIGPAATAHAAMSTSTAIDFFGENTSKVAGSWIQRLATFKRNARPPWVSSEDVVWEMDFSSLPLSDGTAATTARHIDELARSGLTLCVSAHVEARKSELAA